MKTLSHFRPSLHISSFLMRAESSIWVKKLKITSARGVKLIIIKYFKIIPALKFYPLSFAIGFVANGCLLLQFLVCVFIDTLNVAKFNPLLPNSTPHQQTGGRKEIYFFLFFFPRISTGPIKGPGDIPWIENPAFPAPFFFFK